MEKSAHAPISYGSDMRGAVDVTTYHSPVYENDTTAVEDESCASHVQWNRSTGNIRYLEYMRLQRDAQCHDFVDLRLLRSSMIKKWNDIYLAKHSRWRLFWRWIMSEDVIWYAKTKDTLVPLMLLVQVIKLIFLQKLSRPWSTSRMPLGSIFMNLITNTKFLSQAKNPKFLSAQTGRILCYLRRDTMDQMHNYRLNSSSSESGSWYFSGSGSNILSWRSMVWYS